MFSVNTTRNRKKRMAEINVVPYIDVLLVLLIIFMVTIPLMNQSVTVDLPRASTSLTDKITQIPIILTINSNKEMSLNIAEHEKNIDNNRVVHLVAAHLTHAKNNSKNLDVMVRAHNGVDYQSVLDGIMLLKQAGAPSVGLMTSPTRS